MRPKTNREHPLEAGLPPPTLSLLYAPHGQPSAEGADTAFGPLAPNAADGPSARAVAALSRAWLARQSDSRVALQALNEAQAEAAALPPLWQALALVVRGETARLTGEPAQAVGHASDARRLIAAQPASPVAREIDDFAAACLLLAYRVVGEHELHRAVMAEAPTRCAEWQQAHREGRAGGLLFFAVASALALKGLPSPAQDEEPAFVALLEDPSRPDCVRAVGYEALSWVYTHAFRYRDSLKQHTQQFAAARQAGLMQMASVAAQNMAINHLRLEAPVLGAAWAKQAFDLLPPGQWLTEEGLAAMTLADTLRESGRHGLALEQARHACSVLERHTGSRNYAISLSVLGQCLFRVERPADALDCYEKLQHLARTGGHLEERFELVCSINIGLALARTGREIEALPLLGSALRRSREMGWNHGACSSLVKLLEALVRMGPDRRAALKGEHAALVADLPKLFEQAEEDARDLGIAQLVAEHLTWYAQWLTQCGQHEQAASCLLRLVEEQQRQWSAMLAEQVQELEQLGNQRLAEQALTHSREREALQASRLEVLERHNAVLEMLEVLSRHLHATTEPASLFESLRQHALPILGGSELRAWVLDAEGGWSPWLGVDEKAAPVHALGWDTAQAQDPAFNEEQPPDSSGMRRLMAPLRDEGSLVGLLAVERLATDATPAGLNRLERQRVLGLLAEHVSITLQTALRQRRLELASEHARREAQAERHGRERVEQLMEAKRRFLAQASHDLRNPLNAIMGFGQLLEASASPVQNRERDWAEHIITAGKQLSGLVEDILDLSRMDAGVLMLKLEDVDMHAETSLCFRMLQTQADAAGVRLINASEGAEPALARADRARVQQILSNLVSNGIKYNRRGGFVQVRAWSAADAVRVDVDDNGLGVPETEEGGLFEPFNRLGRQHTAIEGTGLGLSVVRRLTAAMHGRVLHQRLMPGSRFTVWLPRVQPPDRDLLRAG